MVPVAAGAVDAGERGLPQEGVPGQALEGHGQAHAEVTTDHHTVTEGSGIRTALELVGWGEGGGERVGMLVGDSAY